MSERVPGGTKVLIIGPLPSTSASVTEVTGGAKVLFEETVRQLRMRDFELDILSSSRPRQNLSFWKVQVYNLLAFARVVLDILKKIRYSQLVFLNLVPYAAWIVASSVWVICKVSRRPMALRFFAGNLSLIYQEYSSMTRWLADRTYMRCPLVFVETQQLCQDFRTWGNFRWLPNTRDIKTPTATRRDKIRRLIFVAPLRLEKGLAEVLEACRSLPEGCHLGVFGPRMLNTDFSLFEGHPRATYRGVLEPAEVPRVLAEHDLLLLPSYHRSEGYPGVILEAFQCGVPVIATRWQAIPEVVQHEENGLLVEPRSATALQAAIERLLEDPDLYRRLCRGAERRGAFFRSAVWYDQVAVDLRGLVSW